MRRGSRILVVVGMTVIALLALAITATVGWRPFFGPHLRPLTTRTFERTAERMARGRYLANSVSGCISCHSEIDLKSPGFPPLSGTEGSGRVWKDEGMPWLVASNITPDPETGAGTWTDDMLARAIREGIGHDGRTLFPMMPYQAFRNMSDEDLASVVVYIRSLSPVRKQIPMTQVPFPLNRLLNNVPEPITAAVPPQDRSDPKRRREYQVTISVCNDCHTPRGERGENIPGLHLAGGFNLTTPSGEAAASNLTPDPTGIPYYDEALFIQTMRTGRVVARKLSDAMPWALYRNMTDEDLGDIFAYLQGLTPIRHVVDNSMPPTKCGLCGYRHGGGDKNKK